jgi:hypothetical protein
LRQLNVQVPGSLWQRLHAYWETLPRGVTKGDLVAEALDAFLTQNNA